MDWGEAPPISSNLFDHGHPRATQPNQAMKLINSINDDSGFVQCDSDDDFDDDCLEPMQGIFKNEMTSERVTSANPETIKERSKRNSAFMTRMVREQKNLRSAAVLTESDKQANRQGNSILINVRAKARKPPVSRPKVHTRNAAQLR